MSTPDLLTRLRDAGDHAAADEIVRLRVHLYRGTCPKCNAGPLRESCAHPEACEHPGRELAAQLNATLLEQARLVGVDHQLAAARVSIARLRGINDELARETYSLKEKLKGGF